jgi:hypothetical protein
MTHLCSVNKPPIECRNHRCSIAALAAFECPCTGAIYPIRCQDYSSDPRTGLFSRSADRIRGQDRDRLLQANLKIWGYGRYCESTMHSPQYCILRSGRHRSVSALCRCQSHKKRKHTNNFMTDTMLGFSTRTTSFNPATQSTMKGGTKSPPIVDTLKRNEGMRLLGSSWKTSEDTKLIRNRKVINKYLRRIGRTSDQTLSLDSHGFCCLPFKKFLLIIEVPEDDGAKWFFYAKVFDLKSNSDSKTKLHQRKAAVKLSDMSLGTKGATLGLDGNEVNLCFSMPVEGLKYNTMTDCIEDFIHTAVEINARLQNVP